MTISNSIKSIIATALFSVSLILTSTPAAGWGREGHETIAKLAELNLDKSTRKTVEKYLGGHSIVYYAKWMDQVRKLPQYKETDGWHTAHVDRNLNYMPNADGNGDAVTAVEKAIQELRNYKELPDSLVSLYIKYLLHFVGDMHCPSHVKFEGRDHGVHARIQDISHKYVSYNLHSIWDYAMIQGNRIMSATEWATELNQVLDKKQKKEMAAGTPREWFHSNAVRCEGQFEWVKEPDSKLGPEFVLYAMPLIETQISYGGIRLAAILNELF